MSASETLAQLKQSKVEQRISDSLTKNRIDFLKSISSVLSSEKSSLQDEDLKFLLSTSLVILRTYNYYQDPASRAQALETLTKYVEFDASYLVKFSKYILAIASSKHTIAITDYLTLLEWANLFVVIGFTTDAEDKSLLVENQAKLLDAATLAASNLKPSQHVRRIMASITSSTQYSVSTCLKKPVLYFFCTEALKFKSSIGLGYLGVIAASVSEVQPLHPQEFSSETSQAIVTFYTNDILPSKVVPHLKALYLFNQHFVHSYVSKETLFQTVLPALEKAILKSSEVISSFAVPLFECLDPHTQSLGDYLVGSKLLTHLISAVKATKETTRASALRAFEVVFSSLISGISEQNLTKLVDEILKAFKATSNADIKHDIVKTVSFLTPSPETSKAVLAGLLPAVSKDQNETSLFAEVETFIKHFFHLSPAEQGPYTAQIKAGLADKKLQLRRIWFQVLGQALYEKEVSSDLAKEIYPTLAASLVEAQKSPLPTINSKGIVCAYVSVVLSHQFVNYVEVDRTIFSKSLTSEGDKFSILVSPEVISKLSEVEIVWCARALGAVLPYTDINAQYGVSLLHSVASDVSFSTNKLAVESVKKIIDAKVSDVLIDAIYSVLELEYDSDLLKFNFKYISLVLSVLTQTSSFDLTCANLSRLVIACSDRRLGIKNEWVGLAQRSVPAVGDVGVLVEKNYEQILKDIFSISTSSPPELFDAALKAASTASFIKPELVVPKLVEKIESDIDVSAVNNLDSTQIKIWQAKEGEVVVDVLLKKENASSTNSRDSETRKWEEELKKELAQKNKKLTKQEQALVNEQLQKESVIRQEVNALVQRVVGGLRQIQSLVAIGSQIDNGAALWYPRAISKVLQLCCANTNIVGDLGTHTLLQMSDLCTSRVGQLRKFIGVATLRLHGVDVGSELSQEPILELVGRILFRVKMLADQRPLDSLSLAYLLPLLVKVLEAGQKAALKNSLKQVVTSEFVEEDPEEEQLLLAIEIIESHSENFADETIPRTRILQVLISLMGLASKAKLAKECYLSLCPHIAVNISPSDLQLLLSSTFTPNTFVKSAILEGIDAEFELDKPYSEVWIMCHDNDANVAEIANTIWQENELELGGDVSLLLSFAGAADAGLRLTVARAVSAATRDNFETVLTSLIELYRAKENPPAPEKDEFGLVIRKTLDSKDPWEERSTVALSLGLLCRFFTSQESVVKVFTFLVDDQALGDREDLVRQELQEAGVAIIAEHGLACVEALVPIFERCLSAKDSGTKQQDRIRESVIILYGALGRHLDRADPRLVQVVDNLLGALATPSEDVQWAVLECIAPLVSLFSGEVAAHLDELFDKLYGSGPLAARRGAAYGIAGLVKGAGIKSLSTHDVMRNITDAADDKDPKKREGVAFVLECLSLSLGKFFEPYVIEVLPIILKQLGDPVPEVREATDFAARQIMKTTTSFGVKRLIPVAIANLDDTAWRSKKGSVELLGSMAYLDPAQLSASLSTIVPQIVGVLNDTHKEVRKAADQSLKRFGDVIRNPEIQAVVPDLIRAIGDPTKYTDAALDKLIQTQFVHYIDGPSLALIIHVVHRGMRDRSAGTKKKACQIVGNMAILVDTKDLRPYLGQLVHELEGAMVDPVPATRSTAARALGSLVEKLGEDQFPDLIPRLLDTLEDRSKAGDRLGSAQALSEVICGLGAAKLDELLPVILANAAAPQAHVRAGFMPLLLFLPVCFGSQFAPYLSKIIPPILAGLADTDEDIRDTALRAGRLIVKNYATKAVDLLLPELELGLSNDSYRIRLSSLELTGDLLFQITGISGKNEMDETSVEIGRSLADALGSTRRDKVLSCIFICRSDVAGIVRSAAVDIWKALVANTPRTVKEILPSLTSIIVKKLASADETHRTIAATTLGEMVRRVGANALAHLLPTLELSLDSGDEDTKQGICVAVGELVRSASPEALGQYCDVFIRLVRRSLTDPSARVRSAAAAAFDALLAAAGKPVVDDILPRLLQMLQDTQSGHAEYALLALQDIMAANPETIFPVLMPSLLAPPTTEFKARSLASLASVAGPSLYRRLSTIINTLVDAIIATNSDEIKQCLDQILVSVTDDAGVNPLMQQLLSLVKHEDAAKRAAIYQRLGPFFSETSLDYSLYTQDIVGQFVMSLDDKSPEVVQGTFDALTALVKHQSKESLERLVKPAHQALVLTGVRGEEVAGFKLNRGPTCILPVFLHGLMYGNNEQRELSALSIADIIDKTPATVLRPLATIVTGPLIRVVGEKVASSIKVGIIIALTNLLNKIAQFLRPFIPQLQRTFVRSLSDSNSELRDNAVIGLGVLIAYQPRVDSLITELVTGAKNAEDAGVKMAMIRAMLEVISKSGANMNENSKTSIMALVEEELSTVKDDKAAVSYARLIGSLSRILSPEEASSIISSKILKNELADVKELKFSILAINSFLKEAPHHIFNTALTEDILTFILTCASSSSDYLTDNATIAIGKVLLQACKEYEISTSQIETLINQLCVNMVKPSSSSNDTRRLALVVIRTVSRFNYSDYIKPYFSVVIPSIFACIRDTVIPIRLAAEKAYLSCFNLVEDTNMNDFNEWFGNQKDQALTTAGQTIQLRSIGDYTKRVASRLATVERERIEAGGDKETLFSDRIEDEEEVWAVGGIELQK